MKKNRILVLLIAALAISLVAAAPAALALSDVDNHWGASWIRTLTGIGAISGYPDGTFKPNNQITRAEFSVVLAKSYGIEEADGDEVPVIPETHWGKGWIEALAGAGVIDLALYPDGYDANGPITRQEIAMMVTRALADPPDTGGTLPFTDTGTISAGYTPYVTGAYGAGIISVYPDNTFKPTGTATRAEAAVMTVKTLLADGRIDRIVENVSLELQTNRSFVPGGGGQQLVFTLTVRDQDGLPLENTPVSVFANNQERGTDLKGQLSPAEGQTDGTGQFRTTFTTTAGDDRQHIGFMFTASAGDRHFEQTFSLVVTSQATPVEGIVRHPFTGDPVSEGVLIFNPRGGSGSYHVQTSDGRYMGILPAGTYDVDVVNVPLNRSAFGLVHTYQNSHSFLRADSLQWLTQGVRLTHGVPATLDFARGVLRGTWPGRAGAQITFSPVRGGSPDYDNLVLGIVAPDGSFVIPLSPGTYELGNMAGGILRQNVQVRAGEVISLGNL